MSTSFVTRFAPSPTGGLHLGHAYSALTAYDRARAEGGRFLLRIEDIDQTRCRDAYIDDIYADLAWLGLDWERPVRRQSEHFGDYRAALDRLSAMGLVYPCFCTRKDIAAEIARSPSAPHGPEGALYPGLCRNLAPEARQRRIEAETPYALRLNAYKAVRHLESKGQKRLGWRDPARGFITAQPLSLGDVVLARKDAPTSYHLAVTVDDHLQGVSHVVRGEDLFHATHIHALLQALLGYATPIYQHHPLITDADGKRFAKRDKAATLKSLRESGASAADIRKQLGLRKK